MAETEIVKTFTEPRGYIEVERVEGFEVEFAIRAVFPDGHVEYPNVAANGIQLLTDMPRYMNILYWRAQAWIDDERNAHLDAFVRDQFVLAALVNSVLETA